MLIVLLECSVHSFDRPGQGIIFMSYEKISEWVEGLPLFGGKAAADDA